MKGIYVMNDNKISYKKIIDIILKYIPTDIDPDNLNVNKINEMFIKLKNEINIDDNILDEIKEKIINLLENYNYSVSKFYDEEIFYKHKSYFENFRLYMYDYRIKLAKKIQNNYNSVSNYMNKCEFLNYDVDNIEKFVKNCFYINYDKEPNSIFVPDNFIKMIYSYFGLENDIPYNLSECISIRNNSIDEKNDTNYSSTEKNYDRFIKFLVKDIKTKFLLKQKNIIFDLNKYKESNLKLLNNINFKDFLAISIFNELNSFDININNIQIDNIKNKSKILKK